MTQIIENWSLVTGMLEEIAPHPTLKDYLQYHIILDSCKDVDSFPNLARQDMGKKIIVNVKNDTENDAPVAKGKGIKLKIRKAAGQVYFAQ